MTRNSISDRRFTFADRLGKCVVAACLLLTQFMLMGCSSASTLTLKSEDAKQYTLPIGRGYFDQSADGVIDVVLLSNTQPDNAGPLAAAGSDLRHVMHIRLHWLPTRRVVGGADQTSNATVDWCVLPDPSRPTVVYSGAGSARFNIDGSVATLNLFDIPVTAQGVQRDQAAITHARLGGTTLVQRDSMRVRELLGQAADARTAALHESPILNGPPARSPVGP